MPLTRPVAERPGSRHEGQRRGASEHDPHDQNRAAEGRTSDPPKPLDEAAEQQILKSLVKQRIDAAEMFRKGGREELAEKEEAERKIIESYLPAARQRRRDATPPSRPPWPKPAPPPRNRWALVMKAAQAKLAGKTVDGKVLSEKVKARLS